MRRLTGILAVTILTLGTIVAQTAPSPGAVTPGSLRILSPKNGDKVVHDFVDLSYELAAPASADSSPTFQVRLDASEPVRTTDTRYTLTGLKPGRHTVSVQVVDANNTPLQGSRAEVHFTVAAVATPQSAPPVERRPSTAQLIVASAKFDGAQANLQLASFQEKPASEDESTAPSLPQSSSALPFLSLIGLSGLVCGLLSARHTRHR